jgi:uncharacterized damage-inducible protein DinB
MRNASRSRRRLRVMEESGLRLDKSAILDRLMEEKRRLYDVLAQLMPEQRSQPETIGSWSVKDVVAHMIFWNRLPIRELECALSGSDVKQVRDPRGDDEINAETVAHYQESGFDVVMSEFERTHRDLLAAVETLPNHAFEPDGNVERLLGDTVENTLNSITYDHWALHRAQIEARFNID